MACMVGRYLCPEEHKSALQKSEKRLVERRLENATFGIDLKKKMWGGLTNSPPPTCPFPLPIDKHIYRYLRPWLPPL